MTVDERDLNRQIERDYRHNFLYNLLDGTFFWAGSSLFASTTILPVYVSNFTDSGLLIGLLSMIGAAGWLLPQLFTANLVQRLPRKKVWAVRLGFFTERVPVFLLVPAAMLAAVQPALALGLFFVLYAWHALGAGFVAVAWQDMVAKIIPADRRGRFFGLTNFLGTVTGVLGAWAAAWLLDRHGFPGGYVRCFALASVLIALSWITLAQAREPAVESRAPRQSQRDYWRGLPRVLRSDPNFARFLFSQAVIALGGLASGFLAVYAVGRWDLPDGQAGIYTASMLIGQALTNLVFGQLADRRGHKVVLELSTTAGALAVGIAALAPSPGWFYLVFGLMGANTAGALLSGLMITLEFGPSDLRPTYIGLNNTVRGTVAGVAPILAGWLSGWVGYRALFGLAFAIALIGVALLRWGVREPRHAGAPSASAIQHQAGA